MSKQEFAELRLGVPAVFGEEPLEQPITHLTRFIDPMFNQQPPRATPQRHVDAQAELRLCCRIKATDDLPVHSARGVKLTELRQCPTLCRERAPNDRPRLRGVRLSLSAPFKYVVERD